MKLVHNIFTTIGHATFSHSLSLGRSFSFSLPPSLPTLSHSAPGVTWCSGGQLAVGDVSGRLAVWGVEGEGGGREEKSPPTVSLQREIELDAAVFSLAFDHHMKLVN